jgi:hypothetical protein
MNSASSFLRRWSQRKLESAVHQAVSAPPVLQPQVPQSQITQPQALPEVASLGFDADFSPFMQPGVDAETRRTALRKLFMTDHYRAMDGLDVYVGDYSRPALLSSDLLQTLEHAQALLQKTQEPVAETAAEQLPDQPKTV